MIHIPAEKINLRAPYRVKQVDDNVFAFVTKHGISYTASFVADVSFFDEGVYQFFLTKTSSRKGRKDDDISETVKVIIEEFFAREEVVMLYICDTADGRQTSRDRLFRAWFHSYVESKSYSLYTEGMTIDNVRYLSSVLMRRDHPLYMNVLGAFHNFIAEHNQE
jgi:hypothetical protein